MFSYVLLLGMCIKKLCGSDSGMFYRNCVQGRASILHLPQLSPHERWGPDSAKVLRTYFLAMLVSRSEHTILQVKPVKRAKQQPKKGYKMVFHRFGDLQSWCYWSRLLIERQSGKCRSCKSTRCILGANPGKVCTLPHTQLCHAPVPHTTLSSFTHNSLPLFHTNPFSHTTLSHTHTHTHRTLLHTTLSHTRLFRIQLFKTTSPPPFPLSFLPCPYRFNHGFWLLGEVDLWGHRVLY